jgi:hypothetical protein
MAYLICVVVSRDGSMRSPVLGRNTINFLLDDRRGHEGESTLFGKVDEPVERIGLCGVDVVLDQPAHEAVVEVRLGESDRVCSPPADGPSRFLRGLSRPIPFVWALIGPRIRLIWLCG